MTKKTWKEKIVECGTALDLFELEREASRSIKSEEEWAEFYGEEYFIMKDKLLGRTQMKEAINQLVARVVRLERHEHGGDGRVVVPIGEVIQSE